MTYDIVYIGATWCAPCKSTKPFIIEKAAKYGLKLTLYDMDDDPDRSFAPISDYPSGSGAPRGDVDKFDADSVKKLPTIRVRQDGKQVAEFITNHVAALEEFLSTHVSLKTMEMDF